MGFLKDLPTGSRNAQAKMPLSRDGRCHRSETLLLRIRCATRYLPTAPNLISTYPSSWTALYVEGRYETVDPVIRRAIQQADPSHRGLASNPGICRSPNVPRLKKLPNWDLLRIYISNRRSEWRDRRAELCERRAPHCFERLIIE